MPCPWGGRQACAHKCVWLTPEAKQASGRLANLRVHHTRKMFKKRPARNSGCFCPLTLENGTWREKANATRGRGRVQGPGSRQEGPRGPCRLAVHAQAQPAHPQPGETQEEGQLPAVKGILNSVLQHETGSSTPNRVYSFLL